MLVVIAAHSTLPVGIELGALAHRGCCPTSPSCPSSGER